MNKRWKWVVVALAGLVAVQLLIDGLHAAYVAVSLRSWEASVERDADGVLAGCGAYSLPAGGDREPSGGVAVLLVHGINASPRHYDLVAPALAERGVACRVMRLPGFAEPLPAYAQTTSDRWVAEVTAELAALRKKHERVGLVAHSLGGAVAIQTLIDQPEAADFAVLLAPAVAVSSSRSPVGTTRFWHDFGRTVFVFTGTLRSPYPMDCRDPQRSDHPGRTPFTPIAVVEELFRLMDRNRPEAERFVTPVSLFVSTTDPVVDTPSAEAYFGEIGSEDKRLIELEQSGHAIPLDQEWQSVVDEIAARSFEAADPDAAGDQSRASSAASSSLTE
ncbi:Thermostable monoacylglycerol lipase [Planctomycetes bacterium MalM25]|nr:Thermostable monoacylglycerol lipase [Planctomycetes bacterium MalM25]